MALAILGAVLTVAAAGIGLRLALQLWNDHVAEVADDCPAAPVPPPRETTVYQLPKTDIRVRFLSVRDDAVELDVRGERIELPGYPPPSSPHHEPATLTTAAIEPGGEEIAIAGICRGDGGPRPSCARKFVRIYQVLDGAHIRDLNGSWESDEYERRVLTMAFDQSGFLAVLVRATWADCMWEGVRIELIVYRVSDGTRILRRVLENNDKGGARSLAFTGDEIRVVTTRPHREPRVRVVQMEWPGWDNGEE